MTTSRREMFAALLAAAASTQSAAAQTPAAAGSAMSMGPAIPGKRSMILHNDRPEDLESPGAYFDQWVTPIDSFFVRQHIPRPAPIDPAAYKLTINGMVSSPRDVSLADLKALPQFIVPATLECTGNGRGF